MSSKIILYLILILFLTVNAFAQKKCKILIWCQIRSLFVKEKNSNPKKRVYLCREKARYRKISNNAELKELLVRLDFEVVYAEELMFLNYVFK